MVRVSRNTIPWFVSHETLLNNLLHLFGDPIPWFVSHETLLNNLLHLFGDYANKKILYSNKCNIFLDCNNSQLVTIAGTGREQKSNPKFIKEIV